MTSTQNITLTFFVLLISLFTFLQPVSATEISGTLSSDGKTQTQNENESASNGPSNKEASDQVTANGNQLHGSVVGGREDSAAVALADPSSESATIWAIPLAAVIIASLAYIFWRRRTV